jgi:D-serine deaminase-like pyridoxal phosphate-dependent protein
MAERIQELPAEIRPHIKVHKSPELARLQVEAGAIGVSVATVWEAIVMVRSGLDHVFVVNTIVGDQKVRALAELALEADVMVAVDDVTNAEQLDAAARAAGSVLGVFVEVDTGMDRCGVDTPEQGLDLARHVQRLSGLRLAGVTGYEGHCALTVDHDQRLAKERSAMAFLIEIAELLEQQGIPCPMRSAGGTATWDWTAAYPGVTEIQAGSYVAMDNFHGRMVGGFEHSLTVQATVISRRPERVIVDAGAKSMGAGDLATIVGHPLQSFRFDEEHGIFAAPQGSSLALGDVVALVPGYSPSTVNWYDAYYVVEDEVVVDVWPVIPRGPGHHGLISA